jgi:predicted short-subunit dehydrogenase-like oxidoreductase (DUF2520 family)
LRLSIIGAGRVGQTIGRLAHTAGYEIIDVVCRSQASSRAAIAFIGAGRPQSTARAQLLPADVFFIATPDDRISDAVKRLLKDSRIIGGAVVLHASGALASDILSPLRKVGFATGSCHPLQTFESPARAIEILRDAYFCIEGQPRAVRAARRLVKKIGARHFESPTELKSLYHAAAVMASGGVTALVSISLEMLARCGLSDAQSRRVLLPLVEGTVANIRAVGPARALTGPVRRGDAGTIARNLHALAAVDASWREIYRQLAARGLVLAERAKLNRTALAELQRLLKQR